MIEFWKEYEGLVNKEEHLQHVVNQIEQIVLNKEELGEHYKHVITMILTSYFDDLIEYCHTQNEHSD